MRKKKILMMLALVCAAVLLTGCRTRTTGTAPADSAAEAGASGTAEAADGTAENAGDPGTGAAGIPEAGMDPESGSGEPGSKTKENPDASRKEYDENAPAEIIPGTDRALQSEGEGSGTPYTGEDGGEPVSRLNDGAEQEAVQTAAAPEAEKAGTDPGAEEAESALTYFTVLLGERTGSLFECQRLYVYWETAQDHVTVHRSSPEHALILNAGAYDVSARLLEENLQVDDGWVARKDPGVIVKIVRGSVLGGSVSDERAAEAAYRSLVSREGWREIDAVRNGRVVLLSEELLQAPSLQVAAMLIIARTANPELYADTDPGEALRMLAEEAAGTLPAGIYYYQGGK